MKKNEIYPLINEYIDGELDPAKENYLFTILSSDNKARGYFKDMMRLKQLIGNSGEDYPVSLDEKIIKTGTKKSLWLPVAAKSKYLVRYAVYLFLLAALFLGFIMFDRLEFQSHQLTAAREKIERQKEMIELVTSSQIYPVTVEADYNEKIIIEANL